MDFLNKAFAQLSDLFRSMTPGARITSALLLAVVAVSLAYLFNHQVVGGNSYLLGGQRFSTAELHAIEAAFGKAGLGGYEIDGTQVRIPRALQAQYMAALAEEGAMPAQFGSYLTDAITRPGPFTTRPQQEAMIKIALQRELAAIIGSMQGIERAAVLYDSQKARGLHAAGEATASVSVKPLGSRPLEESQVPKIRHLVASAIAGLSPDRVTVVDLNGRTYSPSKTDGVGSVLDDPYLERVKYYQQQFQTMVLSALGHVPGVSVTASVELDREMHHRQVSNKVDPKAVAIKVQETTNTDSTDSGGPAGRPGLEGQQSANTGARLAPAGKTSHSEQETTSRDEQSVVSTDQVVKELAGLTPKRVMIAVTVPSSYYSKVWQERNPAAAGQPAADPDKAALEQIELDEKTKIQNVVAGLIPAPDASVDNRPLVTVTSFTDFPVEEIVEPALADNALAWLGVHWSTLGMAGLGLVSLVMLRSMVRSAPVMPRAPDLGLPPAAPRPTEEAKREAAAEEEKPKGPRLKRRLGTGPSLRDELADMVREDPDAAANILRGWIGNAS